ncbi:MAG: hypothetical protein ACR2N0_07590 [Rubrobacteraceae bacterium]|jgi:hypothetical protein|nr:hypothetical protein [Rubrobacter sp.]
MSGEGRRRLSRRDFLHFPRRPCIAGGLHGYAFARDDDYALMCRGNGGGAKLYDLREDPDQQTDIAWRNREVADRMYEEYILADVGGEMPSYDA